MRALGVDPGSIVTGFGLVDEEDNHLFHISSGTINLAQKSQKSQKSEMSSRLQHIYVEIDKLIHAHKPDALIIEKGFYSKNVQVLIKLSQVSGVIILASVNAGIKLFEYTPLEVKQSVVGYGAAKKEQVQYMVNQILRLDTPTSSHHAADALALAICHLNSSKIREML
ncbi:MAG: crossover junction endodeoxyribonuclease RuvC [Nitrospirae bacterium]|nr:crossover junction endodeoxyribonuclease RuvC [Nitrospirota bacterium]